jgi:hypothetical protein
MLLSTLNTTQGKENPSDDYDTLDIDVYANYSSDGVYVHVGGNDSTEVYLSRSQANSLMAALAFALSELTEAQGYDLIGKSAKERRDILRELFPQDLFIDGGTLQELETDLNEALEVAHGVAP